MQEEEHKIFRQGVGGAWEVWCGRKAKLPGTFQTILHAQRAYDQYKGASTQAKRNKK